MKGLVAWALQERDRDPATIRQRVFAPVTQVEAVVVLSIAIIVIAATPYPGSGIDWGIFAGAADGRMENEFGLGYYYAYWLLPIFDLYDSAGLVGQILWSMTNVVGVWLAARVFGSRPALVIAGFGALSSFYTGTITGVALGALAGAHWAAHEKRWTVAGALTLLSVAKPQWGVPLTGLVLLQAGPRFRDLARAVIVPLPVVAASFAAYGWWPGEILDRVADNPPVGNGSLWSFVGPAVLVLWLPVLLPMDPQRRLLLTAATSMMAVPYVQQYDHSVLWVMGGDGFALVSHLSALAPENSRVMQAILIVPVLVTYAWVAREPVRQAWAKVRGGVPIVDGGSEQPA